MLRVYRDPDRKPLSTIVKEVVSYCASNRESPQGYINRMLFRKSAGDPRRYIADSEVRKVHLYQRDRVVGQFFSNKVLFYHHLKQAGVRLPKLIGYNVGKRFFLPTGARSIETPDEFSEVMGELVSANPQIFVKPSTGAGGGDILLITSDNLSESFLAGIHKRFIGTSYIFQERVRQHARLQEIYSGSVNSMRVMTCMRGRDIEVLSAVIRFGANGNHVDNISSGGLYVGIDLPTGKLVLPGRRNFRYGGGLYTAHPDTGRSFSDFTIPFFPEVMETAIKCCEYLPYKLIGWDIAVGEEGPVVIEGNDWPNLDLVQVAYGGYKSHPSFGPFVQQILSAKNGRSK